MPQRYWLPGGVVFILERVMREVRGKLEQSIILRRPYLTVIAHHVTYISKIIQHPSRVLEVQIKKEHTNVKAGQYIFINCPSISYFQYHPFTLTSAPEEDYISVHMRCVGDWTSAFAKSVGADWDKGKEGKGEKGKEGGAVVEQAVGKVRFLYLR